jgi:Ca-activated chloride channel family protein
METIIALDYESVRPASGQRLLLLAQVIATTAQEGRHSALNISAVIDRSGSMQGKKLEYVKTATELIPQYLGASDRFSLVTYDDSVEVRLTPRPGIDKDYIRHVIRKIVTGGSTNLSGGWLQGCQLVAQEMLTAPERPALPDSSEAPQPQALALAQVNRVFLLTDGIANAGITDPARLEAMSAQKRDEGITTTTIGVGMDFNEDLLVRMAQAGGGEFYFIDSPDQASQIFGGMLGYLIGISAQNLSIQVQPLQGTRLFQQISQYPQQAQGDSITYRLGDLTRDERKSLLLEVELPPLPAEEEYFDLALVSFEYDDVTGETAQHKRIEQVVQVRIEAEESATVSSPNPTVQKAQLRLQAHRARQEAIQQADKFDFQNAKSTLQSAADAIEHAKLDDPDLQTEHDLLREEAMDMELGQQRYDSYSRKTSTSVLGSTQSLFHTQIITGTTQRIREARESIERHGPPPSRLVWKHGDLDLTQRDHVTIGKDPANDIQIDEVGVSRQHCRLERDGQNWILTDLDSTNGSYANRGRVTGRFRLSEGDILTVGTWLFRLEGPATA